MKNTVPLYAILLIAFCRIFSHVIAALHVIGVQVFYLRIPACIRQSSEGIFQSLQKIWNARLLKKIVSVWVRSPFRKHALQLVNFNIPVPASTGLILVTCHTPWKRLLVSWFSENHYALILDTARSRQRAKRLREIRKGHNELLHIIRHLRMGGRVIIAADVFNKLHNQPAEILGKPGNLSLLPARLARIAGVPILASVPRFQNGTIQIHPGPVFNQPFRASEMGSIMHKLLEFFEGEIRKDPSVWSYFVNDRLSEFHKKRIE